MGAAWLERAADTGDWEPNREDTFDRSMHFGLNRTSYNTSRLVELLLNQEEPERFVNVFVCFRRGIAQDSSLSRGKKKGVVVERNELLAGIAQVLPKIRRRRKLSDVYKSRIIQIIV